MDSQTGNIRTWYADRRKIRVLRSSTLLLRQRLVFSGLCYFDRFGKGGSASALHRLTGLCRTATIPRILHELKKSHGVVAERDGQHHPVEPGHGALGMVARKVHASEPSAHWSHRYAYDWHLVPAPSSSLTPSQNAVLWRLAGLSKDGLTVTGQTQAGLAKLVGISRHAVADALRVLEELGFLTVLGIVSGSRLVVGFHPPDQTMLDHFVGREPTSASKTECELIEAHVSSLTAEAARSQSGRVAEVEESQGVLATRRSRLPEPRNEKERKVVEALDERGFPPRAVDEFLGFYREVGHNIAVGILNLAAREHRLNFAKEKGVPLDHLPPSEGVDCSRLLGYKIRQYAGRV